jgi:hypothetical protein
MTSRPLTPGEIQLARSVFGDAIDYAAVTAHNRKWWPFQPRAITMAPDGDLWFHPRGDLFCDDFCQSPLEHQSVFIHEMVHVWQAQQRGKYWLPLMRHPFCRYDYVLEPGKPFDRYGIEQQAEIVRHAFLLRRGVKLRGRSLSEVYDALLPFTAA